jgi:hypothetical protein
LKKKSYHCIVYKSALLASLSFQQFNDRSGVFYTKHLKKYN